MAQPAHRRNNARVYRVLLNSPVIVFIAGLVLWLFTYRRLDYTIGQSDLFWKSAVVGIVLALLLFGFGPKEALPDTKNRFVPLLLLAAGFAMLLPCTASLANYVFAGSTSREQTGIVISKHRGMGKDRSWYIRCVVGNTEAQFTVQQGLWNSVEDSSSIIVVTKTGALGYDIVEDIRPSHRVGTFRK